jgi:hypothetical protein
MAKTIAVKGLIEEVNQMNQCSIVSAEMREGWNNLLEHILVKAKVYAGFNYYTAEQLAKQNVYHPPGVILNREDPSKNQFPDTSRRYYHVHKDLA